MGAHHTLRTPVELAEAGLIEREQAAKLEPVAARYAVAITPAITNLIDLSDPHDPIARQFVPDAAERHVRPEENSDPIGDERHSPLPGIVHRYADRVLLKLTHICPVYCRFCFRREMVGPGRKNGLDQAALEAALGYIADHPKIWEVILTGGDPLVLSPRRLKRVVSRLAEIEHVKILRWHTRVPVVAPERITPEMVRVLRNARQTSYVVLHANHPRELTEEARGACARLVDAGIPMLSQSVLLRGVNDDAETLEALMRSLVEVRVKPYYLHHADIAPGTAHHRTTIADGQALARTLHARASGLCQPHYVLDIPGGFAKARLAENDVVLADRSDGCSEARLRDAQGTWHEYPPPC
jgi:lysine 2,3-aminomutase